MTDEITRRQQLEAAGKRAAEKQPDETHLRGAPEPAWVHAEVFYSIGNSKIPKFLNF